MTKKIFVFVCILATVYLVAQTTFAKNLVLNLTKSEHNRYETLQQKIVQLENEISSINTERPRHDLLLRIERLEQNSVVSSINSSPEDGKAAEYENDSKQSGNEQDKLSEQTKFSTKQSDIEHTQVLPSSNQELETSTFTSEHEELSMETKKRLQQQAALRDLSQKLELLALDTLSSK